MTVWSSLRSTFPADSTPANCERAADFELGSVSRSNVATTSSTVNGVPSCHWTPWRMVKSQVDASAPGAHFVASRGVRT